MVFGVDIASILIYGHIWGEKWKGIT